MNSSLLNRLLRNWLTLRRPVSRLQAIGLGVACILLCLTGWWLITQGAAESRLVGPLTLPSPAETFSRFSELWNDFALTRNVLVTLRRVSIGFALALMVGIPIGVTAGCFPRVHAFLSPLIMIGRNVPLAAVLPLMIFIFGAGEKNKVMFIFVASVASAIAPSHPRIAAKISLSFCSCIFEPATREATFCSSITFQLMNCSTSG